MIRVDFCDDKNVQANRRFIAGFFIVDILAPLFLTNSQIKDTPVFWYYAQDMILRHLLAIVT